MVEEHPRILRHLYSCQIIGNIIVYTFLLGSNQATRSAIDIRRGFDTRESCLRRMDLCVGNGQWVLEENVCKHFVDGSWIELDFDDESSGVGHCRSRLCVRKID